MFFYKSDNPNGAELTNGKNLCTALIKYFQKLDIT